MDANSKVSAQSTTSNERVNLVPPGDKPKRPLSAYNLFYRFKRQKVLDAVAAGTAEDEGAIRRLLAAEPGWEDCPHNAPVSASPDVFNALRRQKIRMELGQNTEARDTRARSHRKNHNALNGTIGFVELGKLMNVSWRSCDAFARSVFNEMADEGRARYRRRMEEYKARSRRHNNVAKMNVAKMNVLESNIAKTSSPNKKKCNNSKKLPTKKKIAAKTSPPPSLKDDDDASGKDSAINEEESATNETAEAMVQLAMSTPSRGNKISSPSTKEDDYATGPEAMVQLATSTPPKGSKNCGSFTKRDDYAAGPSLLDLLIKNGIPDESKPISQGTSTRTSTPFCTRVSTTGPPPNIPQVAFPRAPPSNVDLMLRVGELERQLAGERLRARALALEGELMMSRQDAARDCGLLMTRSVLGGAMSNRNRAAAAAAPFLPPVPPPAAPSGTCSFPRDGLWSLVSASMIHPSVRASERATMLSRIVAPRGEAAPSGLPLSAMSRGMGLSDSVGEHMSKRQRFG